MNIVCLQLHPSQLVVVVVVVLFTSKGTYPGVHKHKICKELELPEL